MNTHLPVNLNVKEEAALAYAQATIQRCIDASGLSRAEVADRMGSSRSFITRILKGDHNLTVKTLARAVAACGFKIGFRATPIRQENLSPAVWESQTVIVAESNHVPEGNQELPFAA